MPEGQDFTEPPDGYSLIHAKAGMTMPLDKFRLQFGLTVDNLLNVTYRNYLNRFRYFADEMGRNISVKVKVVF
ncbi:MAG: hypothetical protein R3B93_03380 [Bacteroidia bacterium]